MSGRMSGTALLIASVVTLDLPNGGIVSFKEKNDSLIVRYCVSPEPNTSLVETNEKSQSRLQTIHKERNYDGDELGRQGMTTKNGDE